MKIFTLLLLIIFSGSVYSEEPEGLKRYREKMTYWKERWESAFKCDNRYKVAMFMYDATSEKGAHPSEVLSEVIENTSIENPTCIVKSLDVLPVEKVEAIIKRYYETPNYNKPSVFYNLVKQLRDNKSLNQTGAKDAPPG